MFCFELVPFRGEKEFEPRPQNEIHSGTILLVQNFFDDHPRHFTEYRGLLSPG